MSSTGGGRQPKGRVFTRREVALGLAGVGIGGALGALRLGVPEAAASGSVAGATLIRLATHTGWRTTWDLIVPLSYDRAFPRPVLLYDRAAGEATLISVDASGAFSELAHFTGWRTTWESITPSLFPRVAGVTGLVAYDKTAGALGLFQIDRFGNFRELRTYPNRRKSWTTFVPIGTAGLLGYDRGAGFATLYSIDASGTLQEIRSYNDWRTTWDLLTMGPFTTGAMPAGDFLLYDRAAGQAAGLTVTGSGDLVSFANYAGWRKTWDSAQGGMFLFQGTIGSGVADLLLFDRNARELEFLDIGPNNLQTSVLLTPTPESQAWTSVTPVGPDLILLYNRANGTAGFYVTNRASLRTPTPIPPTPTPRPTVTPTPPIVQTGTTNVRLQQGKGSSWNRYTAKSDNPKTPSGRQAYITGVKNNADKRVALIHREKSGKRFGPAFVKSGEVSSAFNGMLVGGDWEGLITSSRSEAPARIPIEIRYEIR